MRERKEERGEKSIQTRSRNRSAITPRRPPGKERGERGEGGERREGRGERGEEREERGEK